MRVGKKISRQRLWQMKQKRMGNCVECGKRAVAGHVLCLKHKRLRMEYRQAHPEALREYQKQFNLRNPNYHREWRAKERARLRLLVPLKP